MAGSLHGVLYVAPVQSMIVFREFEEDSTVHILLT